MNVLIVGGGGREHALAWKAAASPRVARVFVAPGNAGTAREAKVENIGIAADDIDAMIAFAHDRRIDLTIIGPEAPLVAGIVDAFTEAGLRCFGPGARAAELEGSKGFCKDFLARHGIPTAAYRSFSDADAARAHVRDIGVPVVVKADGLAAGKGVVVAQAPAEALAAVDDMLSGGRFGDAGRRVVVEEFLEGEEASFIVMSDGRSVVPLASSQDHKARDDGDAGPNTGGMGAYSPAPVVTPALHRRVMDEIIAPVITGMREEGREYRGFLYAGLMIAADGSPRVLEFNCRFGDPEAQPVLMRLNSDLVEMCLAGAAGGLGGKTLSWDPRAALGVVLAAEGYPGTPRKGDVISGLDADLGTDVKIFHGSTADAGGSIVTAGGRVLCATALGRNVGAARQRAYAAVERIHWNGMFFRRDIGSRALAREN